MLLLELHIALRCCFIAKNWRVATWS